jgi:nucleoid DNA-binding protein
MKALRPVCVFLLVASLGAALTISAYAQLGRPRPKTPQQKLATAANLTEEQATRAYEAFGSVVVSELSEGKVVNVPNLGTFRLVRIPDYKDIRDTRPVTTPAHNVIEFSASTSAADASNSVDSKPAENVQPMHFDVLPGQVPGQRAPGTRTPTQRTTGRN